MVLPPPLRKFTAIPTRGEFRPKYFQFPNKEVAMRRSPLTTVIMPVFVGLMLISPTFGQEPSSSSAPSRTAQAISGEKMKIKGVIVKRDADKVIVRDERLTDWTVSLTNTTKVEQKTGFFSRPKNYATTQLLRGLNVEVEGRGDSTGALTAEKIKFSEKDYRVAQTVESRVTPVEQRVGEAETRLNQSEQNAQRLSGQLEELSAISNAAKGGAKAAQETADQALTGANQALSGVRETNTRISSLVTGLDEYEAKENVIVNFRVGSAMLSSDAKAKLDELANKAKMEKGFVVEVTGFASSDGSESFNKRLSEHRADAVIRYLVENHNIPLRRIITPFGYGELQPIADNHTREGRKQNRRVEVKILVNRGLTMSADTNRPAMDNVPPE
jgi:outer membrane protein OmpA-like peptidoglycan-associated protein